jgi:hypothetical protein
VRRLVKNYKTGYSTTVVVLSLVTRRIRKECQIRGVSFVLSDGEEARILDEISSPSQNMETVILEKAPRIAVYTLKGSNFGMMRLHLFYAAEIPFTQYMMRKS